MQHSFRMIDVGNKPVTYRLAVASGEISVGSEAFALIRERELPKGDVLMLAEVAGITGAKKAYDMIPLCHPMGLDHVKIITELNEEESSITVFCFASTHAKTGVEMEALAGVNAALLTIWDLTKMVEPDLRIENIRLLAKLGGKKGLWLNPADIPAWVMEAIQPAKNAALSGRNAVVVTMSDRAHKGEYEDKSGALLKEILTRHGAVIADYRVVPDDSEAIRSTVLDIVKMHAPALIVCTGGTGVSPRDVTPEALAPLFDSTIPGIGELLRSDGAQYTPLSWSSRAVAGVIGATLVVTLPGNPSAVNEGMGALLPALIPHLIRIIRGENA
jgi:cyclic pyranopterin phosphate synthase